jgi:hypothetical protein
VQKRVKKANAIETLATDQRGEGDHVSMSTHGQRKNQDCGENLALNNFPFASSSNFTSISCAVLVQPSFELPLSKIKFNRRVDHSDR